MWDKIKQWPTSVKLAVGFLIIIWGLGLAAFPLVVIAITLMALTWVSVFRVIKYLMDGR